MVLVAEQQHRQQQQGNSSAAAAAAVAAAMMANACRRVAVKVLVRDDPGSHLRHPHHHGRQDQLLQDAGPFSRYAAASGTFQRPVVFPPLPIADAATAAINCAAAAMYQPRSYPVPVPTVAVDQPFRNVR